MYEIFSELLQRYGITAYKVSKDTGITQSTLSDWKRGKSTPKTENMKKIADYFGVSIEYLMTGKDESAEKSALTKNPNEITKTEKALEIFNSLRPEFQEYALEQVKKLAELQNKI